MGSASCFFSFSLQPYYLSFLVVIIAVPKNLSSPKIKKAGSAFTIDRFLSKTKEISIMKAPLASLFPFRKFQSFENL